MNTRNLLFILFLLPHFVSAQQFQVPLDPNRISPGVDLIQDEEFYLFSSFAESNLLASPIGFNITRLSYAGGIDWSTDIGFDETIDGPYLQTWEAEEAYVLSYYLEAVGPNAGIIKLDQSGNVLWNRRFGDLSSTNFANTGRSRILERPDGTLLLAAGGERLISSTASSDLYLAQVLADGGLFWGERVCFSCLGQYIALLGNIIPTADGNYLLAGTLQSPVMAGPPNQDGLLIKFTPNGNLLWTKGYNLPGGFFGANDSFNEVVELPNGNFVLAGFSSLFGNFEDGLLVETDPQGNFLRSVRVNFASSSHTVTLEHLVAVDNETVVFSLSSVENIIPSSAAETNALCQIQLNGTIDWAYNYFDEIAVGYLTQANSLLQKPDGGYAYLANDAVFFDNLFPVLISTDSAGVNGCQTPLNLTAITSDLLEVTDYTPTVLSELSAEDVAYATAPFDGYTFDLPVLDLGPDINDCTTDTVLLDASIPVPASYQWNTGALTNTLQVTTPGIYSVTVTSSDECLILTDSISIQIGVSNFLQIDTLICGGSTVTIGGVEYASAGQFFDTLPGPICDTLLELNIAVFSIPPTTVGENLCQGDTLFLYGQAFTTPGIFPVIFSGQNGCDSTILVDISVVSNPPNAVQVERLDCETAELSAPAGFTYVWSTQETTASIEVNTPGDYTVTITNAAGCDAVGVGTVPALGFPEIDQLIVSDYNGFGVSCFGASDGSLQVQASGGTLPYDFQWSTGSTATITEGLSAGTYGITITDAEGCEVSQSAAITTPTQITYDVNPVSLACTNANGSVTLTNISGGAPPYDYILNGSIQQENPLFNFLVPGLYDITVEDENGCFETSSFTINDFEALFADLGPDQEILLGNVIELEVASNSTEPLEYNWKVLTSAGVLSCTDCPNPSVLIEAPIIKVEVTISTEDDCIAVDELTLRGIRGSVVYIPNAFSPNGDSANDRFEIFPDISVVRINYLRIYDRFGNLVFDRNNLEPTFSDWWDGTFNGREMNPGVFAYILSLQLVDGEEEIYTGDVTLLK